MALCLGQQGEAREIRLLEARHRKIVHRVANWVRIQPVALGGRKEEEALGSFELAEEVVCSVKVARRVQPAAARPQLASLEGLVIAPQATGRLAGRSQPRPSDALLKVTPERRAQRATGRDLGRDLGRGLGGDLGRGLGRGLGHRVTGRVPRREHRLQVQMWLRARRAALTEPQSRLEVAHAHAAHASLAHSTPVGAAHARLASRRVMHRPGRAGDRRRLLCQSSGEVRDTPMSDPCTQGTAAAQDDRLAAHEACRRAWVAPVQMQHHAALGEPRRIVGRGRRRRTWRRCRTWRGCRRTWRRRRRRRRRQRRRRRPMPMC